ncbi:hypothetical protein LL946_06715 [Knoellia locipacati]|uniref:hypothetical protein n=1 Tax=Knoellia locipacati TaxID=882824 RepID=UPI00384BA9C9
MTTDQHTSSAPSEQPSAQKTKSASVNMREFGRRWAALAVTTTAYAIVTRPGAEPSDRTEVLFAFPCLIALIWVIYPVVSRFLRIEPTRMAAWEFVVVWLAVGGLSIVRDGSLPIILGVALAIGASAVLAYESATIRQRERDGDTAKTFFSRPNRGQS